MQNRECPDCAEDDVHSKLKSLKMTNNEYILLCTNEECLYHEVREGTPMVTAEHLALAGLPGQLLDHMDVYPDDVDKIIRFAGQDLMTDLYNLVEFENESIINFIRSLEKSPFLTGLTLPRGSDWTDFTDMLRQWKTAFELANIDIEPAYKQKIIDILSKVEHFKYPDDIFKE